MESVPIRGHVSNGPTLCANTLFPTLWWTDVHPGCYSKRTPVNANHHLRQSVNEIHWNHYTHEKNVPHNSEATVKIKYWSPIVVLQKVSTNYIRENGPDLELRNLCITKEVEITKTEMLRTCPPPNTNEPNFPRSLCGIHAANKELNAGNVVPSPIPIKMRSAINAPAAPSSPLILEPILRVTGVKIVNTAVDRMPKPRMYLPPKRSHNSAPGTWVIT